MVISTLLTPTQYSVEGRGGAWLAPPHSFRLLSLNSEEKLWALESWVKVAPANLGAVITAEETAAWITALSDTGEYLVSPHTMFYKS